MVERTNYRDYFENWLHCIFRSWYPIIGEIWHIQDTRSHLNLSHLYLLALLIIIIFLLSARDPSQALVEKTICLRRWRIICIMLFLVFGWTTFLWITLPFLFKWWRVIWRGIIVYIHLINSFFKHYHVLSIVRVMLIVMPLGFRSSSLIIVDHLSAGTQRYLLVRVVLLHLILRRRSPIINIFNFMVAVHIFWRTYS